MVPDYISESYGFDLSCDDEKQVEIYNTILERISELTDGEKSISDGTETAVDYPSYYIESKAAGRIDIIAINGGLFFLGVLLGAVFLFGTVLIMYYKQISEGYEDQNRFDILMKVGMTRKEVKQSINSQVLTVFFLPLITAGIHLAFAYPLISKILAPSFCYGREASDPCDCMLLSRVCALLCDCICDYIERVLHNCQWKRK